MADEKKLNDALEELQDDELEIVSGGKFYEKQTFGKVDPKKLLKQIRQAKNNQTGGNKVASNSKEYLA